MRIIWKSVMSFLFIILDSKIKKNPHFTDDLDTYKTKIKKYEYEFNDECTPNPVLSENTPYPLDEVEDIIYKSEIDHRSSPEILASDQFLFNENKFRIVSTYSHENYTTTLNPDCITEQMKIEAERIEQVIY